MSSWPQVTPESAFPEEQHSLLAGLRVIRERWWVIAGSFAVCVLIAAVVALSSTKQYKATSTLLVHSSGLSAVVDPNAAQSVDPARETADVLSLVSSGTVAARVKRSLNLSESVSDLQSAVTASGDPNDDLVTVSISDPDPARAAALATAFATATVASLTESAQAQVAAGEAQITAELARLPATDTADRALLEQALKQVVTLRAVTNGNVEVADTAQVPTSAASPNLKRDIAIGAVAGIVLGLALAFLLDIFDRRVKTAKELERLYGLPALGTVPFRRRSVAGERASEADLEPFRILRDGLSYISLRKEGRVILVTSAVVGEGKTRVAGGLAQALALANRSVALVDGDVHRPALHRELGVQSNGRGLMNAIADGTNPLELLQPVPDLGSLSLLPCGPFTPMSAELLRLPALTAVFTDLADAFEFVIVDGPPLLPVADAQVLLANELVDIVLIVARPYLTTRDQVRDSVAALKRHGPKGIGLVINGVRNDASGDYYTSTREDAESPVKRGLSRLMPSR